MGGPDPPDGPQAAALKESGVELPTETVDAKAFFIRFFHWIFGMRNCAFFGAWC